MASRRSDNKEVREGKDCCRSWPLATFQFNCDFLTGQYLYSGYT